MRIELFVVGTAFAPMIKLRAVSQTKVGEDCDTKRTLRTQTALERDLT